MNCKHCGYPVNRGQKVCPGCGKPVKRKKGLAIFLSILLILALIVCVGLNYHAISNFFTLRGASDAEYYRHVEEQNISDLFRLASLFEGKEETSSEAMRTQAEIQLSLGDMARQLLSELNTGIVKLDWIETFGLTADVNRQDGLVGADVGLILNQIPLVSLNAVVASESGEASLVIPELTDAVMRLSTADLFAGPDDGEEGVSIGLQDILNALPTRQERRDFVLRYLACATELIEKVERGSGTLSAGDLTVSCTALTAHIDADTASAIALALCRELRGDAQVKQIVVNASDENAYAAFLEELDATVSQIEQNGLLEGEITMVLYVNAGGSIYAREIRFDATDSAESYQLLFALPHKGARYGLELSVEDQDGRYSLSGGGKLRGLTLSGTFVGSQSGEDMLSLDAEATLKGVIKGELAATLRPERALLRALDLPAEAESLGKELSLSIHGNNLSGDLQATVELLQAEDAIVTLTAVLRSLAPAEVPVLTGGLEPSAWLGSLKLPSLLSSGSFGTLFDHLKQAGMPGELITGIKLLLPSLLN